MTDRLEVFVFTEGLPADSYARIGLEALARGIAAAGDRCRVHRGLDYQPCDVAVIFGDVRDAPAKRERMRLKAEVKGRHIHRGLVVIDTPVLLRSAAADDYRRLGLDGIHRDSAVFAEPAPDDGGRRWSELAARHGLTLGDGTPRGERIHVCLQRLQDASLRGAEGRRAERYLAWLQQTLRELRQSSPREVVVRPHPGSLADPFELAQLQHFMRSHPLPGVHFDPSPQPLAAALSRAWATVSFNSGAAVDSLLHGVPAVTGDPGSFAWPIAAHEVSAIDMLELPDRTAWLQRLAWVDWSLDELADGSAWRALRRAALSVV